MGNSLHGRVLHVDLTARTSRVEEVDEDVYRKFLGGYGLGAWLMWKHFPAGTDPLSPQACFAICSGLLTGTKTPFSGRIQIVGKSPLTNTWADSNSGGSVAVHLREAGFDALVVTGAADKPTVLSIEDDEVRFDDAGELWGQEIPQAFDSLVAKYGSKLQVGVSAIGPAGERRARIASVMNDRYHAFGRQGFGAIYGSKNLKAIVVGGSGKVPVARDKEFKALLKEINAFYKKKPGLVTRIMAWFFAPKSWLTWVYRFSSRTRTKLPADPIVMRNVMAARGTTSAVALSVENGDAPIRNWTGAGSKHFPLRTKSLKIDGAAVSGIVTKRLSCGDCPMPCKGIVKVKSRKLDDVRRPDYETLIGFGANLLNDDLGLVTACHDACNRYGMDAVSSSATLGWVCEAMDKGLMTPDDLDGIDMRWGNGEAALQLTVKIGEGDGCGEWLQHGVAHAAEHFGKGTDDFAVHIHGSEPAYHDPRFTSLMGVNYISDPTPGRHTTGSATWNETFASGFALKEAVPKEEVNVKWKSTEGKGLAQAHYSNAHQVLNGLGLCMFTGLFTPLPWLKLVKAATGWDIDEKELLACGERIQNMRAAFNRREGITPADFVPHRRLLGEGDGKLEVGPLAGIEVPLIQLRTDYYEAMHWDPETGHLRQGRAKALGLDQLLEGYTA